MPQTASNIPANDKVSHTQLSMEKEDFKMQHFYNTLLKRNLRMLIRKEHATSFEVTKDMRLRYA